MEEWRDVVGYEKTHMVSNMGRVKTKERDVHFIHRNSIVTHHRKSVILAHALSAGYPAVTLSANGTNKTTRVHCIVAAAFLGPIPSKHEVRHRDGNRLNPHLSNLEYGTKSQNRLDAVAHGTMGGENVWTSKLTADDVREIRARLKANEAPALLSSVYGVNQAQISAIATRRQWKHVSFACFLS